MPSPAITLNRRLRAISNKRRLPGTRPQSPLCSSCGHKAGSRDRVEIKGGRVVCGRCRDRGVLAQRLPCGHIGTPDSLLVFDSADASNLQCLICTPHHVTYILGPRVA